MSMKAYVLINVDTPHTQEILDRLRQIRDAVEVNEVIGPYDVVVELETESYEDLAATIRDNIRPHPRRADYGNVPLDLVKLRTGP